ncbi:hypothetical protein H2202_010122 [Exophiala xenobiotica]|nr:hypothetical protein H2202_010122 [Exophiala xenobiotica]KAK5206791.1 hypothetical protein LTR41_007324 [Exophiala xenobiotica]KAK5225052.1 hypothetical protein LTR47_009655 [Exophiala xenobiotica]KAK5250548.1 hypothetical protein LTS06_004611 [Exophiala xenobiotica]KAK5262311.1 hypothetical protein LTR40_000436 [Exophiala xenobiotica]
MAAIGGSGCLTLLAGMISDLFVVEKRGLATAIWSLGPLIVPVVLLIAAGATSLGNELLNKETYARVLIRWNIERPAKELGRSDLPDLRSCYDKDSAPNRLAQILLAGLARAFMMFVKSPIVPLLSVYMAIVYDLLYLLFTTITVVFSDQYGWSPELTGRAYLGVGIGFFLGLTIMALLGQDGRQID